VIVGRDQELQTIREFVDSIADGPAVLVLEGEPGAGKTTLFSAAVDAARQEGLRVLQARPSRAEAELSFAGLGDLLEGVLGQVEHGLPEPQRQALRAALHLEPPGHGETGSAVAAGLLGCLRELGRIGPTLVAVDDLQWLDRSSADALAFAARRLGNSPVGVLAARRSDEPGEFEDGSRLVVGPLSLGAIRRMLRERMDMSFPRATLGRLHEISGGNPFYALELARALAARGGRFDLEGDVPIPADLSELLRERLAGLPEATREAVDAAAVAGEPTAELLRALVGADGWNALEPAFDAEVIERDGRRIRFAHPLLAAAALQRMDPQRRRELNARLAELVDDVEQRARHLALAAVGPDASAAETLEEAAEAARRRGAPDAAAELLEHALRLTADDDDRARLTIAAAAQHNAANDAKRATGLLTELLDGTPSRRRRAEALLELLRAEETSDRVPELAEAALAEVVDDDGLRAEILLVLTTWEEIAVGIGAALARAGEAVRLASGARDDAVLAVALAYLGHLETLAGSDGWLETLQRAQELQQRGFTVPAWLSPEHWIGVRLMWGDELDPARELLEAARRQAADAGDASSQSGLCFHLAQLETRAGAASKARDYAEEGWELVEASGRGQPTAVNAYARALVEVHFGDPGRAREIAGGALSVFESLGDRFFTIHTRSALATLELSQGNHSVAAEALAPCRELRTATEVGEPGIFPFDADEIEALIGVGHLDEAVQLTDELESRARELDRARLLATSLRSRGLLAAAHGDLDAAIALFDAALAEHDRLPVPLERGRTLLALGSVQRRARQKRAARVSLEDARDLFEQIEERSWLNRAVEELGRIGGRAPARGTLTAGERRIADLAAEGRSNKEIAAALFLSVNTVESTLSRVYTKVGVRSRTELASRLATEK
jgi:DNA-binding CsgD family transcriptional regulator